MKLSGAHTLGSQCYVVLRQEQLKKSVKEAELKLEACCAMITTGHVFQGIP